MENMKVQDRLNYVYDGSGKPLALVAADATDGINFLAKLEVQGKPLELALIDASGKDQSIRVIQREGRLLGLS